MLADVLQAIAGVPELAGIVAVTVDPDAADIALRAGEQAWGEAHRDGHTGAVMAADLQIADRQEVRNRQARDAYDRHRRLRNRPGREVWLELDDGKQVLFGRTTWSSRTALAMRGETRETGPSRWLSC